YWFNIPFAGNAYVPPVHLFDNGGGFDLPFYLPAFPVLYLTYLGQLYGACISMHLDPLFEHKRSIEPFSCKPWEPLSLFEETIICKEQPVRYRLQGLGMDLSYPFGFPCD